MDKAASIRQLLCPKTLWINDKDVNNCQGCDRAFVPLLVWRHHCRFCGKVFCDDCDSNVLAGETIGYEEKKLRHCNPCKMKIAMVLNEQPSIGRASIEHSKAGAKNMKIEIEDPDTQSEDRKTVESLRCLISEEKMAL